MTQNDVVLEGGGNAYLFGGHGLLGCLVQLFNGFWIESQILLAANKDDGQTGTEVQDFGDPLSVKIFVRTYHQSPQG